MRFPIVLSLLFFFLHRGDAFLYRLFAAAEETPAAPPSSPQHGQAYPELQPTDLDELSSLPDDLFTLTSPLLSQAMSIGQQQLSALSTSSHAACSNATSISVLHPLCHRLSEQHNKMRLAMLLTNCHLARSQLSSYPCSADSDVEDCAAAMGRDAVAFGAYTLFLLHAESVCLHVLHRHAQEATVEVIASLFSATITTAKQLQAFQHDTRALSTSLLASLTSQYRDLSSFLTHLAANESSHYADIRDRAQELQSAQQDTLDSLRAQSDKLQGVLQAVARVGDEVQQGQQELGERQHAMGQQQLEQAEALKESRSLMHVMHEDQRAAGAAAIDALSSLLLLHGSLLAAQKETRSVLEELTSDVTAGFTGALSSLSTLSSQQKDAFAQSERGLSSLLQAQSSLHELQEQTRGGVQSVRADVERLRQEELEGFTRAGELISRMEAQAAKANSALQSVLGVVSDNVERILALDLAMLAELLRWSSILFYTCASTAFYVTTATKRTSGARSYVFLCILAAVLLERAAFSRDAAVDVSAYPHHVFLIRTALCTVCALLTLLSAAMYRDYAQLSFRMQQRTATAVDEHGRLIHRLLDSLIVTPPTPPLKYERHDVHHLSDDVVLADIVGDNAIVVPFDLDDRQRRITDFYTRTPSGVSAASTKRRSRRERHEAVAAVDDAAVASSAEKVKKARSRSRKSRKTQSSLY